MNEQEIKDYLKKNLCLEFEVEDNGELVLNLYHLDDDDIIDSTRFPLEEVLKHLTILAS